MAVGYGQTVILRDVAFQVRRGEVFVLLGGSGCGKSTLMRTLVGLQPSLGGDVRYAGGGGPFERGTGAPRFGVMFQSGALFGSMSLLENVALPLQRWTDLPAPAVQAVARARLAVVGLTGFEDHLPAAISGGMRKRAGIARALALEPPVLFLDEPSAGLDPITAVELDDTIRTLADTLGVTTVLVTHELDSIFRVSDRCIMLDKGAKGIIAEGDPRQLRDHSEDARVRAFFNRTSIAHADPGGSGKSS